MKDMVEPTETYTVVSYDVQKEKESEAEIEIDEKITALPGNKEQKKDPFYTDNETLKILSEMDLLDNSDHFSFEKYLKLPCADDEYENDDKYAQIVNQIHGVDSRVCVDVPYLYPKLSIAYLSINYEHKKSRGTGFFVGNKIVLTCGHNLFDRRNGRWAKNVVVTAANNLGMIRSETFYTSYYFKEFNDITEDWGAIELAYPLGAKTGYFGTHASQQGRVDLRAEISGYPGKVRGVRTHNMYTHSNNINRLHNNMYEYDIDTSPGNSGSPVYYDNYAVGIHTRGGIRYNRGVAINLPIVNFVYRHH